MNWEIKVIFWAPASLEGTSQDILQIEDGWEPFTVTIPAIGYSGQGLYAAPGWIWLRRQKPV